jgi:HK97 family phage major capsid protein
LPAAPVPAGRFQFPPTLPGIIPAIKITGGQDQYLQQTTRTNLADAVAPGSVKPTSSYGLTKVSADLVVVAHVSEPLDRFTLDDSTALTQFVSDELTYGVQLAVEDQVLNGSGTDPDMRGLLATSGIQTVAAGTDVITTIRQGITRLEQAGYGANIQVVLNPADWELAELATLPGAGYQLANTPVNRAAYTVWGCPVALSNALAAGTGVLFSQPSVGLYVDQFGLRVDWGAPGDAFTRNQVVGRAELRTVVAAFQPAGVVKATFPVATP